MEKKFKLPKPFATKWLEALRSGKYIQGTGLLTRTLAEPSNDVLNYHCFCCLGVAGYICGNPISSLKTGFLYSDNGQLVNLPSELLKTYDSRIENFPFIQVLSKLNDGISTSSIIVGYNIRPDVSKRVDETLAEYKSYQFSFAEIADFIEDNTNFYETK